MMMQSIRRLWLWSPMLVFIIRNGASGTRPFISRSNDVVADSLAELRSLSCAQQLEKLKMETRRHVNALNAIDYSLNTPRRGRKLLSTIQPLELEPIPNLQRALSDIRRIPDPGAPRNNQKLQLVTPSLGRARLPSTEPASPNSLKNFLSGSKHTGWVSECLKGGKCANSDSEPSGNPKTVLSTESNSVEIMGNENSASTADEIPRETLSANGNKLIPDPVNINITDADTVINSLPSTPDAGLRNMSETSVGNTVYSKNHTVNGDEPIANVESTKELLAAGENAATENNSSNPFEAKPPLVSQMGIFSEPINNREFSANEDQSTLNNKMLRVAPENANRVVHYNPLFLPVKIQVIPQTYQNRLPLMSTNRDEMGQFGSLGAGESALHPTLLQSEKFRGFDSLDSLRANYGNDLVRRGSTGKRESIFSPNKEAVTTTYPEQSGYQSFDDGRKFVDQGQRINASDGPFYFFVGGNWVAHFRDHPQLFYVQPQQSMAELSTNPDFKTPGCSDGNADQALTPPDLQPYRQPYASGELITERPFPSPSYSYSSSNIKLRDALNVNPPSDYNSYRRPYGINQQTMEIPGSPAGYNDRSSNIKLTDASKNVYPPSDYQPYRRLYGINHQIMEIPESPAGYDDRSSTRRLPDASQKLIPSPDFQPYRQPYAVNEQIMERPGSAEYNSRSPVRFPVASKSSYSWYDYNTVNNDVNQRPINVPFSGGLTPFQSANPSGQGIRKGVFRQTDNLNYEDSLVNLPLPNGPVQGSYDTSKPEDFLEHDINTSDMFFVGTQVIASLPLQPTERHEDNSSEPAYGELIADVSSRSSPKLTTDNANSARTDPFRYFPSSRPTEFEFVNGQYLKRRPFAGASTQGLTYDQMGQRRIRNVVGWPINPLNDMQQPANPFKSTCYGRSKRSVIPLHNLRI